MDGFAAVDFGFAREVLQRGIAALYLVAFVSTLNQFRPLLGERGLLPAPELLEWVAQKPERRRMLHLTLFLRVRYSDRRLVTLCWLGIAIAALLVIGIPQWGPPWVPMLCFLGLWLGYMSIVSIGQTFYSQHGIPQVVHADSGPAMRSNLLKDLLADLGVERTHNRPRVSNDNPFSESEFRTMKYRPNYPGTFTDLDHARDHMASYVPWYNADHKHSGIALLSPDEIHDGTWRRRWDKRDRTQQAYYDRHPERFRHRPRTPAPAGTVGINLPKDDTERLQAA